MWAAPKLETRGTRTYAHRAQPWPEGALPADTAPMDSAKKTASDDRTFRGSNPSGSPAHPPPHRRATWTYVPIKSLAGQWMRGYPTDRAQPSPRPPRRRLGGACHAQALMHAVTSYISPLPCVSFPGASGRSRNPTGNTPVMRRSPVSPHVAHCHLLKFGPRYLPVVKRAIVVSLPTRHVGPAFAETHSLAAIRPPMLSTPTRSVSTCCPFVTWLAHTHVIRRRGSGLRRDPLVGGHPFTHALLSYPLHLRMLPIVISSSSTLVISPSSSVTSLFPSPLVTWVRPVPRPTLCRPFTRPCSPRQLASSLHAAHRYFVKFDTC